MFAQADSTTLPPEVLAAGLVLAESHGEWVLTSKFDQRLKVGSTFEVDGKLWTVTWESDAGFGDEVAN